jgi:two-component system cell cycle sensor histidine kinase/response regulator CckA
MAPTSGCAARARSRAIMVNRRIMGFNIVKNVKGGISVKLLGAILALSLAFTIIATGIHSYQSYQEHIHALNEQIKHIERSNIPSIASSLWEMDKEHLQIELEGLLRLPYMQYAAVVSQEKKVIASAGSANGIASRLNRFNLLYIYSGKEIPLGFLEVVSDISPIKAIIWQELYSTLLAEGFKILILSLFILFTIHLLITRHLQAMAAYTRQLNIREDYLPLVLHRRSFAWTNNDELDDVVSALNEVLKNLKESFEQLTESNLLLKKEIIEHKQAEEETRELLVMLEAVPISIVVHDDNGRFLYANQSTFDMHGYSPDEFLSLDLHRITIPESKKLIDARMRELRDRGESSFEVMHLKKNGTILPLWINVKKATWRGKSVYLSVQTDITERKRAEQEMAIVAEIGKVIGSTLNIEEVYERFADEVRKLIPFDRLCVNLHNFHQFVVTTVYVSGESIAGRQPGDFIPLKDSVSEALINARSGILNDTAGMEGGERQVPGSVSSIKAGMLSLLSVPLISRDEVIAGLHFRSKKPNAYTEQDLRLAEKIGMQIAGAIANAQLYKDLKEAEKSLRESEQRYRLLVENADQVIVVLQEGMAKFVNRGVQWSGYSEKEYMSIPFLEFIHPEDRDKVRERYTHKLEGDSTPTRHTYRMMHKNGQTRWIEVGSVLIEWEGQAATLNLITDITDRIQAEAEKRILEERLQRSEKMEALGTLAGGISHDFNNLLMGIQGYTSLMLIDMDASHPQYDRLKRIEDQVQSGANLTKQLLGVARGGRYEVKPTDMNDLLEKSSSMFGRTKKEISIYLKYGEDLRSVEVDRGQMEQVFMNLFVNAWQAMPGGGEIYIETENVLLHDEQAIADAVKPGKFVKISVTDTGTGIDAKIREQIFDPFFTTKRMGRGTGLGLATVYGIIKGHKGMINVYSEPGHGTTFNIYLPASEKEVLSEKMNTETIARGRETILLVDDEKMLTEVSCELLESLGYRVYVAGGGQEAIAVYMEKREEIELVILDMIMPGISGSGTFDRLREINAEVKVLLSSGYSINGQAREILDRGCNGFIQKPFSLEKLSLKVREMLD